MYVYMQLKSEQDSKPLGLIIVGDKSIGTLNDSEEWSFTLCVDGCLFGHHLGFVQKLGTPKIQDFIMSIPSNVTIVYLHTPNPLVRVGEVTMSPLMQKPLGIGSRTWCRPSLSGAAAKWSLPTRTPSSSTGWRMPQGSSDHGMDAARKSHKWLGWKEGVYLWLSSVWIEAGSHVERLSLDLMWTKRLLERNNDRSGSNTMKQEISCATSRVWHTTPI